jgi:hypothetical protein
MSEEYKLLAHLPFTDPESDAVTRIAADLGLTVSLGPEGAPEVNTDTFLIYGFAPDEVDQKAVSDLFGEDINLTLVFTDPAVGEGLVADSLVENMTRSAVLLAAVDGARGVLVTDYTADAIVLRFKDGQVTLNQDWAGWDSQPAALSVVPEPRHLESL